MEYINWLIGKPVKLGKTRRKKLIKKIKHYYFSREQDYSIYYICNVTGKINRKDNLFVEIETSKPGLILGPHGDKINELEEFLSNEFVCDVKIKVTESRIIYNY